MKYSQFMAELGKPVKPLTGQTLVEALVRAGVEVDVIRGDAIGEVRWNLTYLGKTTKVIGELEYRLTYEIVRQTAVAIVRKAVPIGSYGEQKWRISLLPRLTELAMFGVDDLFDVVKLPERAVLMPYPMWVHSKSTDEGEGLTSEWMFTSEAKQAWADYRLHMEMYLSKE